MNLLKRQIKEIKRLPKIWLVIFLILFSGFAEVFGISMLVPVVTSLLEESGDLNSLGPPFNFISEIIVFFNLPVEFSYMLLVVLFFMVLSFALIHFQERYIASSRYQLVERLRNSSSKNLLNSRWEFISKQSSGEISNKLLVEADKAAEAIVALVNILAFSFQLLTYSFLAFLLSWKISLIALVIFGLTALTSSRLIKTVKKIGIQSVEANNSYNKQVIDTFRGIKLIKTQNFKNNIFSKLTNLNRNATSLSSKILINQSIMKFEIQLLISIALVTILFVSVEVLNIQASVLLIFLFIILRIAPKFFSIQGQLHSYSANSPSLDIIDSMIHDGLKEKEVVITKSLPFTKFKKKIEFIDVSYNHAGSNKNAVSNLSLHINANEFVAIVGPSGAGKSTFLDLLLGLIQPTTGKIILDGRELHLYNQDNYKDKIGFVPQDNVFFDGSIEENLKNNSNDQLLNISLEISQIKDFIDQLPLGVKTEVGEAGMNLSGGQKQRLSIARALMRDPDILILDEATSSLDGLSEALFQKAIDSIASQYTLVIVAHRLSTIKKAKRIFVLDKGLLIEEGNYVDLINKGGLFSQLNKSQIIKEEK